MCTYMAILYWYTVYSTIGINTKMVQYVHVSYHTRWYGTLYHGTNVPMVVPWYVHVYHGTYVRTRVRTCVPLVWPYPGTNGTLVSMIVHVYVPWYMCTYVRTYLRQPVERGSECRAIRTYVCTRVPWYNNGTCVHGVYMRTYVRILVVPFPEVVTYHYSTYVRTYTCTMAPWYVRTRVRTYYTKW